MKAVLDFLNQGHRFLWLTLILATFLAFWKLDAHPIADWDEARQGVNAFEMAERGDYINYYYADQLDTWNAKPPLFMWAITASYKTFGYNTFALRLPAALATILFFFCCFRFVTLYKSKIFAFLTCVILMSCHAVLAVHIGRTADFDALLLPLLMASVWAFSAYIDFNKKNAILLLGTLLGLAFYTKGVACIFLIPGMVVYALLSKKFVALLKTWRTWAALAIFVGIAGSWFYISSQFGAQSNINQHGQDSAIKTMLIFDTLDRFNSTDFHGYEPNPFFVFKTVDIRMNVWNYLFYLGLIIGGITLFRNKSIFWKYLRAPENRLALLSTSLVITLAIILSISKSKMDWYLAPIFPFMAMIIVMTMVYLTQRWNQIKWGFGALFVFLFTRHFMYLNTSNPSVDEWLSAHGKDIKNAEAIYMMGTDKQSLYLYLKWRNYNTHMITDLETIPTDLTNYVIIWDKFAANRPNDCNDQFCFSTHGQ